MEDIWIWLNQEPGTDPGANEAVEELAAGLREEGLSTLVRMGWIPIIRGLTPPEEIIIFIGSGVSTALLNAIVTDIYKAARKWGLKRFGNKSRLINARAQEFTIHGPDGEKLIWWWIDGRGEGEIDYRRGFEVTLKATGHNKVRVMKELRALFDIEIIEAKYVVENTPFNLLEDTDQSAADQIKEALENAGATVTVRHHQSTRHSNHEGTSP